MTRRYLQSPYRLALGLLLLTVLLGAYSALSLVRWWHSPTVQVRTRTVGTTAISLEMWTVSLDSKRLQQLSSSLPTETTLPAARRLSLRKESLKRNCARFQRPLTSKEKRLLYAQLVVDDKNRIIWCPVRKAGTTTWRIVMLILMGKFSSVSAALNHVMHNDFKYVTRLSNKYHSNAAIDYRLKHYTKFMAYREPLGRVVSDYRQIRLHDTEFRKRICKETFRYNQIFNLNAQHQSERNPDAWTNVTFPQFVNFVTRFFGDKRRYLDLDIHWKPTNLICHPCRIDYDYLVDLESPGVVEESAYVLNALGAPSWLRLPQENRSGNETKYSFLSQLSTAQFERLRAQYDDDYEIFGYQRVNQTSG